MPCIGLAQCNLLILLIPMRPAWWIRKRKRIRLWSNREGFMCLKVHTCFIKSSGRQRNWDWCEATLQTALYRANNLMDPEVVALAQENVKYESGAWHSRIECNLRTLMMRGAWLGTGQSSISHLASATGPGILYPDWRPIVHSNEH